MRPRTCFLFFHFTAAVAALFAQVASRTDGVAVHYYDNLHEAFNAAAGASIEQPDEITLLADIVLNAPLMVDDGKHIRLVAGAGFSESPHRTIWRGPDLIEYPVVWVRGEDASLSLGKPGMEHELVIDGGRLNSPTIEAHCPLAAVSGPGSKLIMYDKVTLQNNINTGSPLTTSYYENGTGVFIRTQGDVTDRQAEFIMKGGTIRGNINGTTTLSLSTGGGVEVAGFGIFTMEGGTIMNNTVRDHGGGLGIGSRGSFKKTGGIIYGSNAPAAYRNTALYGRGTPKNYGHAVSVSIENPLSQFRNDTVGENENLSYAGVPRGNGIFGEGDKWDDSDKAFRRMLLAIILPVLALAVAGSLIYRKITYKKLMKIAQEATATTPETLFENVQLTDREKEIGTLLLTELSMKQIATVVNLAYATVDYHSRKLYRKLEVQGRMELLIRVRKGKLTNEK